MQRYLHEILRKTNPDEYITAYGHEKLSINPVLPVLSGFEGKLYRYAYPNADLGLYFSGSTRTVRLTLRSKHG